MRLNGNRASPVVGQGEQGENEKRDHHSDSIARHLRGVWACSERHTQAIHYSCCPSPARYWTLSYCNCFGFTGRAHVNAYDNVQKDSAPPIRCRHHRG